MRDLYFKFKGEVIKVTRASDGLWYDKWGCVYALSDYSRSVDLIDRCGIGAVSLPLNHPANIACKAHDYAYSSPTFQVFHTREEADAMLEQHLKFTGYPILGKIFRMFSRIFGGRYWENKETR